MAIQTFVPVIFRKFEEGSIVAIFPTIPSSFKRNECLAYTMIGQHGTCSGRSLLEQTQPASKDEYLDILDELQQIYEETLVPYKRWQHKFDLERNKQFDAFYAQLSK